MTCNRPPQHGQALSSTSITTSIRGRCAGNAPRLRLASGLATARPATRRRFVTTTVKDGGRQAPDLVERNFTAEAPDRLWVADITYIPTWAGFLYVAVVLDAYSRRIVGWSMATTLATQPVLDALNIVLSHLVGPLCEACGPASVLLVAARNDERPDAQ